MGIYIKNPKCPKCGAEIDIDDTIDIDYDDEWLSLKRIGFCSGCNANYQWVTNYPLGKPHHANLEEC